MFTKIPPARFGSVGRPAEFRPRALPWITFPWVSGPKSWIPTEPLPEIRLPAPAAVPPIVLFGASLMKMPSSPFGIAVVPPAFVPILLPWTRLPLAVPPVAARDLESDEPIAGDEITLHGISG